MGDDNKTNAAALELARASLAEEPELADRAEELSNDILDTIEDWIATAKSELEEGSSDS